MAWAVKRGWFAALALLLLAVPAPAAEPSADDRARLPALLKAGGDAAKASQWSACIDAFTAAAAVDADAKTFGELGLCEESAGRLPLAHDHLLRAYSGAPATQATQEPWSRYAAALRRVKGRVVVLFITTDPPNARVVLDGRPLGTADGRLVAVEGGPHTLVGRLDGYEDATQTRSDPAPSMPHVHLHLHPKPGVATSAKPVRVEPGPLEPAVRSGFSWAFVPEWSLRGGLVALAYASAATAVAGGATWIGFEVARADLHKGLANDACDPALPSLPARCAALHERLEQRQTAMQVTAGAAIATGAFGVATGLAAYFGRSPLRPTIAPTASPQGGGFIVVGAW